MRLPSRVKRDHRTGIYFYRRNVYAHALVTTRTSDGKALGKKVRVLDNQRTSGVEIDWARRSWENHANAAPRANGFKVQIDCRSLKDKGIERDARVHLGQSMFGAAMIMSSKALSLGSCNSASSCGDALTFQIAFRIGIRRRRSCTCSLFSG